MINKKNISVSRPFIKGNEWKYIKECLDTEWVSTSGKYIDIFESKISNYTGSKYAISCINGTSALQISLKLVGVKINDEVIIPTLTFIAPVNAIAYNGARPVFMDVDVFHNLDINKTIRFIEEQTIFKDGYSYNKKTKNRISAIIPVHVWGNAVKLDELIIFCKNKNISVVEDASESLGTTYKSGIYSNKHTGTLGDIGCLSFNGNKIITTGAGGMILTDDKKLATKARYYISQAKDDPTRYQHNEIGYNYRLPNINASIGVAQMEKLDEFIHKKQKIHKLYEKGIDEIEGLSVLKGPPYSRNNYWLNVLNINEKYPKKIEKIIEYLNLQNIPSRLVWMPNHLQKPYINCESYQIDYANKIVSTSLCLPSSIHLSEEDIEKIIGFLNI